MRPFSSRDAANLLVLGGATVACWVLTDRIEPLSATNDQPRKASGYLPIGRVRSLSEGVARPGPFGADAVVHPV
jgi:hypothetical protein